LRTIIKHANRRLYDASEGSTITLLELSDIVVSGEVVEVVDKATGENITAVALLQSLLERLKRLRGDASSAHDAERIVTALRRVIESEHGDSLASEAIGETASG
jgi:polyhydroxyalkanoate synthesis regulator protein